VILLVIQPFDMKFKDFFEFNISSMSGDFFDKELQMVATFNLKGFMSKTCWFSSERFSPSAGIGNRSLTQLALDISKKYEDALVEYSVSALFPPLNCN
jgi:hypothetical protein